MTSEMADVKAAEVGALLRARGLRATPQRRAVWSALQERDLDHPSAEEVFARARGIVPELSLATVYNALRDFAAAGLITPLEGFHVHRFDTNPEPHQHFRCRACGALHDIHPRGLERLAIDAEGFTVERMRLVAEGLCPRCSNDL